VAKGTHRWGLSADTGNFCVRVSEECRFVASFDLVMTLDEGSR